MPHRPPLPWTLALLLLASPPAAGREIGAAAGPSTFLAPTDELGGTIGLSASVSRGALRARGEVVGLLGSAGSWAALPTLSGEAQLRAGRLELFLAGGVQMFGFIRRREYTAFATFGLVGGAGLSAPVHRRARLVVRGLLCYLPSFATAKLSAPDGAEKPSYLFLGALVGFDITFDSTPDDDFDFD